MATNNYGLPAQGPTTFTYLGQTVASGPSIGGVLIGDYVNNSTTTPAGSAYNVPTSTLVGGVPVSAQLELQSTTGALLVMRMTTTQRNAMTTVVNGMVIFNTTTNSFQFYQASAWVSLSAGAGGVTGPGSSTNNAIATWSGTAGTALLSGTALLDSSGNFTAVNTIANAVGTAAAPSYTFTARTNTGVYSSAANVLDFATDGTRQLSVGGAVVAVNYLQIVGSVSTSPVLLNALGTDTNIGITVTPKGTGSLTLATGSFVATAGSITAGSSGNAGVVTSYPATATTGSLALTAVASSGNYANVISNASTGQATTWSLPDPGSATANILLNKGTNTMAAGSSIVLAKVTATEAANAVTASGNAGVITTSALTTAGGASYAITWTNTFIATTSVITLTIMGGTNTTNNITLKATAGAGTSTLTIYNNTAATALNGTIIIGFVVS